MTLRNYADTKRQIVLSNLENLNAFLIRKNVAKERRFELMRETAISQLKSLSKPSVVAPLLLTSSPENSGLTQHPGA